MNSASSYLLGGDGRQFLLTKLLERVFVISQVELCAHEDERHARRMMADLRQPLGLDVLKRCTAVMNTA